MDAQQATKDVIQRYIEAMVRQGVAAPTIALTASLSIHEMLTESVIEELVEQLKLDHTKVKARLEAKLDKAIAEISGKPIRLAVADALALNGGIRRR